MAPMPVFWNGQRVGTRPEPVDIDEDTLQKIANMTGGKYYRADNAQKFQAIYGEIDKLEKTEAEVKKYADRVLDGARLAPGMTLADIGTGDGLIAFSAIDRVGPSLSVILTDISAPLLRHSEALAVQRGVRHQCAFIECSAEVLGGIADASVDAVTTRAVLAYVPDKIAAMREFHRILKPGGRLSIAEPVNRDDAFEVSALKRMVDALPAESGNDFFHLLHRWKAAQYPDTEEKISANPFTNYSERDLVRFALDTRFARYSICRDSHGVPH